MTSLVFTSVHFKAAWKHPIETLQYGTSKRDMTLRFAWKGFFTVAFRVGGPLKSWLFWLKRTSCLLYIMIPVLMASGNVWSQMEFSIEFNLCVSQRALGTSSLQWKRYIARVFHPDFAAPSLGPRIEMNRQDIAWCVNKHTVRKSYWGRLSIIFFCLIFWILWMLIIDYFLHKCTMIKDTFI